MNLQTFIYIRQGLTVGYFNDIIKIATMFIEKKTKRGKNYGLKCNLCPYFLI